MITELQILKLDCLEFGRVKDDWVVDKIARIA